jgi:hypothetical protein
VIFELFLFFSPRLTEILPATMRNAIVALIVIYACHISRHSLMQVQRNCILASLSAIESVRESYAKVRHLSSQSDV